MEKEDELFIMSVFLRIGKRRKKVQTALCLYFLTLYIWNCILNLLYLKQLFCGFPSLEISLLRLVASCTNLFCLGLSRPRPERLPTPLQGRGAPTGKKKKAENG